VTDKYNESKNHGWIKSVNCIEYFNLETAENTKNAVKDKYAES
jgi:hypothetical protein